jgi:riboflavin kinase/FMN adenylyltransferase
MRVFRNIEEVNRDRRTVISVGTFDGVHTAHRSILAKVTGLSRQNNARSFIVTFHPHPQEVLKTKIPDIKLLTTTEEKLFIFQSLGIENVLLINFTEEFSETSPKDFYENLVYGKIGIEHLVVGFDHLFGHNREGDFNSLLQYGRALGFTVDRIDEVDVNGDKVSSSKIRKYLSEGAIEKANRLLGYEYSLSGTVVAGDKIGRELGYPTANILPDYANKLVPADGVYCVRVSYGGEKFFGMMNIGFRPTLTDGTKWIAEVNIFGFGRDIYGEKLSVNFITRLRGEEKYTSKDALVRQITTDKGNSLKYLKQNKLL